MAEIVNDQTPVEASGKQPLVASLKAAGASFDRGSVGSGINQLGAFQNKVRAQVGPVDAKLAVELTRAVQVVIDAMLEEIE